MQLNPPRSSDFDACWDVEVGTMILNDLEYQVTQECIRGFERALALLNAPDNELKNTNPIMWQLNVDGVQSLIDDLTAQMQEYEALINRDESEPIIFEIGSLDQLPRILIQARIAAKISQKELAQRLGVRVVAPLNTA